MKASYRKGAVVLSGWLPASVAHLRNSRSIHSPDERRRVGGCQPTIRQSNTGHCGSTPK